MKKVCLVLLLCVVGAAVQADIMSQPYITGDFNGWDPGAITMTQIAPGSGIWEYTITGLAPGQYQQFKITPGDWSTTKPASNSWYEADALGNVKVTFNTNVVEDGWITKQFRIGVSTEPGGWSVVGDFNGWNNNDPTQLMTSLGGGIYEKIQTFASGSYNLKPVWTGKWDGIGTEGRSVDAWNYNLVLASASQVKVSVDAYGGLMKVEVIPEPATMMLLGLGSLAMLRRKK
jgi:hypothetical protein